MSAVGLGSGRGWLGILHSEPRHLGSDFLVGQIQTDRAVCVGDGFVRVFVGRVPLVVDSNFMALAALNCHGRDLLVLKRPCT